MQTFTPKRYTELIFSLLARNYEIKGYKDGEPERPHLILRHDVDFDLKAAVKMAELEASNGWRSCYFVLVRSEFYNLFSKTASSALGRIAEFGHTIGLHFDARLYPNGADHLLQGLKEEFDLVEQVAQRKVETFSLHRPQADAFDGTVSLEGRMDAYAPRYTKQMGYCSDSRGGWHHGEPLDHDAVQSSRGLQLLTHPLWWMGSGGTPQSTLEAVLDDRYADLEAEAGVHCSAYRPRAMRRDGVS
jgi:hypothetical protein